MKVVVDTNILLVSISEKSPLHWVFKAFLEEQYILCVTTDILAEYEEIVGRHMGQAVAEDTLQAIQEAGNTDFVTRYYQWELIKVDYDDNKFVDCAIASNANFLVSHDKHFNVLKQADFPQVEVIDIKAFRQRLSSAG